MFLAWRTQLREAQQASELGRLDDAAQRLVTHKLLQYKPGEEFARSLATAYLARALRRAEEANFEGAAHDLDQARQLGGANEPWQATQARVAQFALTSVERLVAAVDHAAALRQLTKLVPTCLSPEQARNRQDAVRRAESAANLARRGKFSEAEQHLSPALALCPDWRCLAEQLERVRQQATETREQSAALHSALAAADWTQTLAIADRLLAASPELPVAREARQKAWAHVGAKMADSRLPPPSPGWPNAASDSPRPSPPKADAGTRLMLWVDAVGGFLVCLADELWIGQAAPGNAIAIPIQAELSRQHAKLTRSGEGYVLEAAHPVSIDGRPVVGKRVLIDGEEMELGRGVRLRFRQPHSLSATAKLEILSRHRTQPHCDGVLLMAESCVLGPKWQDHIVCKDWANDVVLYRQQNALFCRTSEQVQIDGVTYQSRGPLQPHSHVAGEDFSFSLELLS